MRVAVCGCIHGQFSKVYEELCQSYPPDVLFICGDLQACRTPEDMLSMSVPAKYRQMGDFHEYFSGRKIAPILTVVIGGNHEASAFMSHYNKGGWIAPNIYYIGDYGIIDIDGLKVCGISGIYFKSDMNKPRVEHKQFLNPPVPQESIYSVYHTRKFEIAELVKAQLPPIDIVLTHDWPRGIEKFGNYRQLFKYKAHLQKDSILNKLGNPLTKKLLDHWRPAYWFSAHLHVQYTANYKSTQFCALSKVGPHNDYIINMHIPSRCDNHKDNKVGGDHSSKSAPQIKIKKIF